MKKLKKAKINKNKKSRDSDKNEPINDYNAAPLLNQFNKNEKSEEGEEDENLAPAIDNQTRDFNKFINDFNKKREGILEIQLNNEPKINIK